MIKAVALNVGWRYAFSRRSSISFISAVAVLGLALSVAVLVVVISVINGFERELRVRVLGLLPHVTLYARDALAPTADELRRLAGIPGVRSAAAFVQGAGLAAVNRRQTGVLISGVDPADAVRMATLEDYLRSASGGAPSLEPGRFEVWLGAGVARSLRIGPGDSVTLVLPSALVTPAGLFPRQKRFTVTAVVESQSEIDSRAAYIHWRDAQRLFRLGDHVHGYQLKLDDLFEAPRVAEAAVAAVGADRVFARTWIRSHGNLYRAIGVMKTTMFVLLSFLVAVAAFNLVSTLVMVVDQRSGDIAILRTLGSDGATVVGAFVLLGIWLGICGIGAGLGAGAALALALPGFYEWASTLFGLDLMNQYFVNYLPVQIQSGDLVGIAITALVLCVVSTLYPAWRAALLRPSEVLAYE